MKVIVLGGGVIGVTSAYYLARAGVEVTLIERQHGVSLETSFANAGQISPGYSTPWAAPGIPGKALKWLFQHHAPLAIHADGSQFQLNWMAAMLRNCNATDYAINKERMMRVAEYSRDCLRELRAEEGLQYEQRTGGTLQVFRTQQQLDAAQQDIEVLQQCGVPFELLGLEHLWDAEPGMSISGLVGGLRLPNDETGDCYRFTTGLASKLQQRGVKLRFGVSVHSLIQVGDRVAAVRLAREDGEVVEADHVVMALGSYSRQLLKPLGLDLPVYPVKGYSLTMPVMNDAHAPVSTVLDETYKVAVTRFNHRIRVGGMAELSGFDLTLDPRRQSTLGMVVEDLFPGGGDLKRADFWTGLRPMTPDGTPVIGRTALRNLWLNTGHGTLGWTMAAGSGRLLADLVMKNKPGIRADDLSLDRYYR